MIPAWLKRYLRARTFPAGPSGPVRVDVMGIVASANVATSPITGLTGAMIEIELVDREIMVDPRYGSDDVESLTPLGSARYGDDLVIADEGGRTLHLERMAPWVVIPLSMRPLSLDSPVPPELVEAARRSQHLLAYRETRFREGDRVRVIATVEEARVASPAGVYRGGTETVLVPARGQRLELHELL